MLLFMLLTDCVLNFCYLRYLICSPVVKHSSKLSNRSFHQLSQIFRSILPQKTPRLVMFGPGLETNTSGIVRKIIEDATGMFTPIGMFPGLFGGQLL